MTARHSIFDILDNSPVPSPTSWPARKPPSPARDAAYAALATQARKTAVREIKWRARVYALRPRELDAICEGLFSASPKKLVGFLATITRYSTNRNFGFGGEIPAINLRGAMVYARWSRAIYSRNTRRAP